ncbi:MAG: aldo/keto reductase [Pyrobaculum sp.]
MRRGLELGLRIIDTSELYGAGHTDELVKIAAAEIYNVYVVYKIQPPAAAPEEVTKRAVIAAERLGRRPWILMFHWTPVHVHICDVVKALETAVAKGLAEHYGLSNVTYKQLTAAMTCFKKIAPAAVENRYSLRYRRDELDVLPLTQREGMLYLAYSPLERGLLALDPYLASIGARYNKTAAQVALNWYLAIPNLVPIVKSGSVKHVEENAGALGWALGEKDWKEIDKRFYSYRLEI